MMMMMMMEKLQTRTGADPVSWRAFHFYRATACNATHGIALQFCLSVSPSVTRMDCDKNKGCIADILIPHERAITLLF